MRLRLPVAVACLLLAPACRTYLPYAAQPLASKAEARRVIQQVVEEQRDEHAPVSVDVTDDRFQVVRAEAGRSGLYPVAVYYSRIERLELSRKGRLYAVSIFGPDDAFLMHVYIHDQASAERLLDALETMRAASHGARLSR